MLTHCLNLTDLHHRFDIVQIDVKKVLGDACVRRFFWDVGAIPSFGWQRPQGCSDNLLNLRDCLCTEESFAFLSHFWLKKIRSTGQYRFAVQENNRQISEDKVKSISRKESDHEQLITEKRELPGYYNYIFYISRHTLPSDKPRVILNSKPHGWIMQAR